MLQIEIPKAVSGRLQVCYKIEIKTSLSNYEGDFFAVTRSYDEFEWLLEIMVPEN